MKKLMSLALALIMVLSLAACGGKTADTPKPDSQPQQETTDKTPEKPADSFPEKQVTIIMPWSLGGGPDTIARQVASYGEKYLGVPVIVENHTGGSGTTRFHLAGLGLLCAAGLALPVVRRKTNRKEDRTEQRPAGRNDSNQ